jgi:carbon-monoxide dehydrogenase medium subunit
MLNLRLAEPRDSLLMSRASSSCAIPRLRAIGWRSVRACTHAEIEDGDIPDVTVGLMPFIASGIAYRAVRNRGTIGGSIAHADPAADWLTTTIALDASLLLSGAAGQREIKVADFVSGRSGYGDWGR